MPRSNDWLEKQLALSLEQIRELWQQNKRMAAKNKQLADMLGRPTLKNLFRIWWNR